jgi:ADP-ribose pyrophosphatase
MKILSEKTVFQSKFFQIKQIEIERDGKTYTKDYLDRQPFVVVLPLTENGEVYLEHQFRDVLGRTTLEAVAGFIERDEDPAIAAKRELREETGLVAENVQHIATWELNVNLKCKVHVYVATGLTQGETAFDEDENIELVKMPFDEAVAKAIAGELDATSHVAAILLVDKLKRENKITL